MRGVMHFLDKNYHHLTRSILNRLVSPYEFAGCLNNYPELRRRYKKLMDLEAHDQPFRIRFVNYYTASDYPETVKDNAGGSENSLHADTVHSFSSVDAKENTPCKQSENKTEPCSLASNSLQLKSESQYEPVQSDRTCSSEMADSTSKRHKKKHRKFILLPSHHWSHCDDSLWVPVNMDNMNEITAHQSIFLPHGRNYDQLVGDTIATIEQWIQDGLTQRMLAQDEVIRGTG